MNQAVSEEGRLELAALRLLARREHSRVELRRKLGTKTDDAAILESLLDRLACEGLQSDLRFAEAYTESRRRRGFGPKKVRVELQARGVDQALIAQCTDEDNYDWDETLMTLIQQRFGSAVAEDFRVWSRRARFLESRGFPPERIRKLLPR